MPRPWNTWIALTFVAVAAVGGLNVWNISTYEPLDPVWKPAVFGATALMVLTAPLLTFFSIVTRKQWLLALSFVVLLGSFGIGQIVGRNGRSDTNPVEYRNATVVERELTHIRSTLIYRLEVQLQDPPRLKITVSAPRDIYEQIQDGGVVGLPVKPGRFGIPWRIKGPDIRVVRFRSE